MRTRTYSQLRRLPSFEERFGYLELGGVVGASTFGFDRWVNQRFYRSPMWKRARRDVIARDNGCDLGCAGHEIHLSQTILVHHMNPILIDDIVNGEEWIINPEYLITTSLQTHNAIHYGDWSLLPQDFVERSKGDTKLW
jgi:hypothetical protein